MVEQDLTTQAAPPASGKRDCAGGCISNNRSASVATSTTSNNNNQHHHSVCRTQTVELQSGPPKVAQHNNNNIGDERRLNPKWATGDPTQSPTICIGCGTEIYDQWILKVSPDMNWHAACLKCVDCGQYLDETCTTCFVRNGKTYCKNDYLRLFGSKCSKCGAAFNKDEYVMRAKDRVYHVDCFHCVACCQPLRPGDEFALRLEGLFCKSDHEALERQHFTALLNVSLDSNGSGGSTADIFSLASQTPPLHSPFATGPLPPPGFHHLGPHHIPPPIATHLPPSCGGPMGPMPPGMIAQIQTRSPTGTSEYDGPKSTGSLTPNGSSSCSGVKRDKKKDQKTTRVRTVLNEKQLHTLRTCYQANPRPDALMKEQLVEMTGLSPRVIRVWFQNKRCKDKKKHIMLKQAQHAQEKQQTLNGIRLQGIGPMTATSPMRHDVPMVGGLDVHQFQQHLHHSHHMPPPPNAWSQGDYQPLRPDSNGDPNFQQATPFQQLLHGFGDPNVDPTAINFLGSSPHLMNLDAANAGAGPPNGHHSELLSMSPSVGASDLSSPSCSE